MVFEGLVATLLNKYLGKYIKHLDSKNLSVGIWSGHVVLQDLELRGNALADFGLPIEVNAGYIGKLCLEIPWSSLYSQPVVVKLEDIYLIASPLAENVYDEEKETQYMQDLKQAQLAKFDAVAQKQSPERSAPADENDTFTEKLVGQIVKNLQVFIKNVHLRYEDKVTDPKSPFTIGITMESFEAQTTDQEWKPVIIKGDVRKIYKAAKLSGLSVYWNTAVPIPHLFKGVGTWKSLMKQAIGSSGSSTGQLYVLKPFTTTAHVYLDQSSGYMVDIPKVLVDVIQSHLELSLTKMQFQNLMDVIESFELMSVNQQFRPFCPKTTVSSAPTKWWKYAFDCYVEFSHKPWTWKYMKEHRSKYKKYVTAYFQKLVNVSFALTSDEDLSKRLKFLEENLNVATILIARQQAKHQFLVEKDELSKKYSHHESKNTGGWLGWLGMDWAGSASDSNVDTPSDASPRSVDMGTQSLSPEEKEKLYAAIGYADEQNNPKYDKEYVKGKVSFDLKKLSIKLVSSQGVEVLHFLLKNVNVEGRHRPGSGGQSLCLDVNDVALLGHPVGNEQIVILKSILQAAEGSLLHFEFDTNPTTVDADFRCHVALKPVELLFDVPFLKDLQDFFDLENDTKLKELEMAAGKKLTEISDASRAGVEHAIMHNRTTFLHIDVKSPKVVYPCTSLGESAFIAANLGDFSVTTDLQTELHGQSLREATESDLEAMFYHQLRMKLTNVSVSLHKDGMNSSSDHILMPCNVELAVYRSLKTGYANFPDFKVDGQLRNLNVCFNPCKTDCVMELVGYILSASSASSTLPLANVSETRSVKSRRSSLLLSCDEAKTIAFLAQKNAQPDVSTLTFLSSSSYESAQDGTSDRTDDEGEEQWFNAEEDVIDDVSYPTDVSYDASRMTLDRTKFQGQFSITEIAIQFEEFSGYDNDERANAKLVLCNFKGDVTQQLWSLRVNACLSGIEIVDWSADSQFHQTCKVDAAQPLLNLSYVNIDPHGPLFSSGNGSSEQDLTVVIGKLNMDLSDVSLLTMMAIGKQVIDSLHANQQSPSPPSAVSADVTSDTTLGTIVEEESDHADEDAIDVASVPDVVLEDKLLFNVKADISEISVSLAKENQVLVKVVSTGFSASVKMYTSATEVIIRQQCIAVLDARVGSFYPNVLSVDSDNVAYARVVIHNRNKQDNEMALEESDIDVVIKLSKLRFVIVYDLISSLQSMLECLTSQETRAASADIAINTVSTQVQMIDEQQTKISLDVELDAPIIIIPTLLDTSSHMSFDLGKMMLRNAFILKVPLMEDESERCGILVDKTEINLQSISVSSTHGAHFKSVLNPLAVSVTVERSLQSSQAALPMAEISISVADVKIEICDENLEVVSWILQNNFSALFNPTSVAPLLPTDDVDVNVSIVADHSAGSPWIVLRSSIEELSVKVSTDLSCDKQRASGEFLLAIAKHVSLDFTSKQNTVLASFGLKAVQVEDLSLKDFSVPTTVLSVLSHETPLVATYRSETNEAGSISSGGIVAPDCCVVIDKCVIADILAYVKRTADRFIVSPTVESVDAAPTPHETEVVIPQSSSGCADYSLSVNSVTLSLRDGNVLDIRLNVSGVDCRFKSNADTQSIELRLMDASAENVNSALYRTVFAFNDHPAVNAKITMKDNSRVVASDDNMTSSPFLCTGDVREDMLVMASIAPVKFTFLYGVIAQILGFVADLTKGAVEKIERVETNIQKPATGPSKILLDIMIQRPVVEIPRSSMLSSGLSVTVDNIVIKNTLSLCQEDFNDDDNEQMSGFVSIYVEDRLDFTIQNIKLDSFHRTVNEGKIENEILDSLCVSGKVKRPLVQYADHMSVDCGLEEANMTITENDLNLLAFAIGENFAEGASVEHPSPSKDDESPPMKIKVAVTAAAINIALVSGGEHDFHFPPMCHSDATLLGSLTIHGVTFALDLNVQHPVDLSCEVHSVRLNDSGASKELCYKHILAKKAYVNREQIYLTLSLAADNSTNMFLSLVDSEIICAMTVIQSLLGFVSRAFAKPDTAEGNIESPLSSNSAETAALVHMDATGAAAAAPQNEFSLRIVVNNCDIIALEIPSSVVSPAVMARVSLDGHLSLIDAKMELHAGCDSLEMLSGNYPGFEATSKMLLQPCSMKFKYVAPFKDGLGQDISLMINKMQFSMSPAILKTAINIMNSTLDTEEQPTGSSSKSSDARKAISIDWKPFPLNKLATMEEIDNSITIDDNDLPRDTPSGIDNFHLNIQLVKLAIGNDMKGMVVPLLTLKCGVRTNISDWTTKLNCDCSITAEMSYFNDKLASWEPLLEPNKSSGRVLPYEVRVNVFTSKSSKMVFSSQETSANSDKNIPGLDDVDGPSDVPLAAYVIVNSEDCLQLTVTPEMIDVCTRLYTSWANQGAETCTEFMLQSPFHFSNKLGRKMTVWTRKGFPASTDDLDSTVLLVRKSAPKATGHSTLFFSTRDEVSADETDNRRMVGRQASLPAMMRTPHSRPALMSSPSFAPPLSPLTVMPSTDCIDGDETSAGEVWAVDCSSHTECVSIMVDGFHPIRHVTFKQTGMTLYPLIPWKAGSPASVVSEVSSAHGRKEIALRCPLQIHNHMSADVTLLFEGMTTSLLVSAKELKSFPLDLFDAKGFTLQFDGCHPCDTMITWHDVTATSQNVRCHSQDRTQKDYYIQVCVKFTPIKQGRSPTVHRNIVFHLLPPITISNLLPFPLTVQLQLDSGHCVVAVDAGERMDVFDVSANTTEIECLLKVEQGMLIGFQGNLLLETESTETQILTLNADKGNEKRFVVEVAKYREMNVDLILRSKYWVINKTGMDLEVKVGKSGDIYQCLRQHREPVLINYQRKSQNKLSVRMVHSTWSDSVTVDAVGVEMQLQCKHDDGTLYNLHVKVNVSYTGNMNLITISSQFLVINKTEVDLMFLEDSSEDWIMLKKDEAIPFWPQSTKRLMYVKRSEGVDTSPPFPFGRGHSSTLRLSAGDTMEVDVCHVGQSFFVTFKELIDSTVPVLVENFCDSVVLEVQQKGVGAPTAIQSYSGIRYNWDDLTKDKALQWTVRQWQTGIHSVALTSDCVGYYRLDISSSADQDTKIRKRLKRGRGCFGSCITSCTKQSKHNDDADALLRDTSSALLSRSDLPEAIYWMCHLKGSQRVLTFTEDVELFRKLRRDSSKEYVTMDLFVSMQGVGISIVNGSPKEIAYVSLTGATSRWEVKLDGKEDWSPVDVGIGTFLEDAHKNGVNTANYDKYTANLKDMTLVSPYRGELQRICEPAVWMQFSTSLYHSSLYTRLYRLQIDNQQYDAIYPCVLYPTPLPPDVIKEAGIKPFLEASFVFGTAESLTIIKYFKLLVQEMNLKVDRGFLEGLLSLYITDIQDMDEHALFEQDMVIVDTSLKERAGEAVDAGSSLLLIEYLHLSPLKIHLSFSLKGNGPRASCPGNKDVLDWIVNAVGVTFTEVSDADVRLAYFERQDVQLRSDQLIAEATRHYTLQAVKQFHVLVLGLDVLGNPYGLITDVGKGVKDLFYEPYQGAVAGPQQFAKGLATGVRSLLGHTIGGTANAFSRITDQLGTAVAALSFDKEYQRKRRENMRLATDFKSSVAMGGKNFAMGVVFGLSGIITKPVQGARQGGVEGFFKGVGSGIVGLLAKPTGGVIDLVTSTLDGVRRLAEQGGEDIVCRIRIPRVTYSNEVLECFDQMKAEGFGLLQTVDPLSVREDDFYKDHVFTSTDGGSVAIIMTTERIVRVSQSRLFDNWTMSWSYDFDDIRDITKSVSSVTVLVQEDNCKRKSLDIPCSSKSIVLELYKSMEELYTEHNAGKSS